MLSNSGKAEFLNQFQNIVDGVKQAKHKVETGLSKEKKRREDLGTKLHILIEQQRKYVAAVRQLSIEFTKHETLLSQKK